MKVTVLTILALGAASTQAAAIAAPEADAQWCPLVGQPCWKVKRAPEANAAAAADAEAQWCPLPGQPCWKVKRAASPEAEAEAEAQWCPLPGQPCWKVKRTAEAFAEAIASFGPAGDLPEGSLARRSHAPGGVAAKAVRALDGLAGLVAATQQSPRSFYDSLDLTARFPTESFSKRDASPEAEAQWCPLVGQPCFKAKRAAEAEASLCPTVGQSCWKVARAAEAIVNSVESFKSGEKRDADAQLCTWMGQGCLKRSEHDPVVARCNAEGGQCNKAERDLEAMYNAARSVLASM